MVKNLNVILIGLMGAGKTSIGKQVADIMGFGFIDMDEYIEQRENKSISDLFAVSEEHFRSIETEVAKELGSKQNSVISTGGGVVKSEINMKYLSNQDNVVVYIKRQPEEILKDIDVSNRPLLKQNPDYLFDIYNERKELYEKYADLVLENDSSEEDAVNKLVSLLKNK